MKLKTLQESVEEIVQKAWTDGRSTLQTLEEEIGRHYHRILARADLHQGSEELQNFVADFGKRLQQNGEAMEKRLQESLRNVVTKVRDPLTEDLSRLRLQAEQLGHRIESVWRRKMDNQTTGADPASEEKPPNQQKR